MAKITVANKKIVYKKLLRKQEIALDDIVWAYRQQQDAETTFGGKSINLVINRVIVQDKEGKKTAFPFDRTDAAKKMLDEIAAAAPEIAIGYTEENKEKYDA